MGKRTFQEVGKHATDRLVKSRTFERAPARISNDARRVWIFRWNGDALEGWLRAGPLTNWRRNASYVLELQVDQAAGVAGDEIEFFGNKQIHDTIRNNELLGSYIRIVYIGQQTVPSCKKKRKVYRIFKDAAPGAFRPAWSEQGRKGQP